MPTHSGWWGFFDHTVMPIIVRYCSLLFVIAPDQDSSHHVRIIFEAEIDGPILPDISWEPIRVVGSWQRRRCVDHCISSEDAPSWRLWIWEGRPLSQLYWDPGEWRWPHSDPSCAPVSFFEYSVRISRLSLIRQQTEQSTRLRVWLHEGLSHAYLRQGVLKVKFLQRKPQTI